MHPKAWAVFRPRLSFVQKIMIFIDKIISEGNRTMEFEPVKYYKSVLKDKVNREATSYFEQLVKDANIDVGENISTNNRLNRAKYEASLSLQDLNHYKNQKTFCWAVFWICLVLFIIALIVTIVSGHKGWLATTIISAVLAVGMVLIIKLYTEKKIEHYAEIQRQHREKVEKLEYECYVQVLPLVNHLDQTDFVKIVNKCVNTFSLDETFSSEKAEMLATVYGYNNKIPDNRSIYGLYSGNISSNPFVKFRTVNHRLYDKTYTGFLTITWTTTTGFGENRQTVTHTQTLTAYVTKPAPEYSKDAYLVYGNNAAPDLTFSRKPTGMSGASSVSVDKFVKSESKKLEKMTRESVSKGGSFQAMANTRFEALFGAYDRNNEVQYRLLFTPLAQLNMNTLILNTTPYKDDFTFKKRGKINIIVSEHSSATGDFEEKAFLGGLDIREVKKSFVKSVNDNFTALYFDLAPLLSIPLYQQTEAGPFSLSDTGRNVTDPEAEALINHMDPSLFKNKDANIKDQLLKANYVESVGHSDIFNVESLSYHEEPKVAYIPVFGGDGRMHNVPVPYFVYTEKRKYTRVAIRNYQGTREQFWNLCDEKKYFEEEKEFYQSVVKNRKCLGFALPDKYNYSLEEDERIDEIVSI